jgi:hypothetical protein
MPGVTSTGRVPGYHNFQSERTENRILFSESEEVSLTFV